MCYWWFFTFIHNCVGIFGFIAKNVKSFKKSQNEFQWITKHVFWQVYFLHMWFASKVRHFEPNEHNFLSMVKKMRPLPCSLFVQNFKILKFLNDSVFLQVHLMNMYFNRTRHAFIVQFFWNQLYDFMHSF
jgi:hypothetical protein